MEGADSVKDQATTDRIVSANSANRLIFGDSYNGIRVDADYDKDVNVNVNDEQLTSSKETTETLKQEPSLPEVPADRPEFRGPFGITTTSTIIWYVCICILFVISFICLVLSVLYFVTGTTSQEQVVELYGICGSGGLAIVTFVIIFLDCCNDTSIKDHEEEILYKSLQAKEAKEKQIALRRSRRIADGKIGKPKPFVIQSQQPTKVLQEPLSLPPPYPHAHPHPYHHYHHTHHVHAHPSTSYHHPFVCPICHDLHASGNARHNLTDVAVDTSDKFAPVFKNDKVVHKSTRDAQTQPTFWDAERGTQTDRTEGTQTSTMELSGMPSNIAQIIHETTILKAPRNLISTLKESMRKQDKDIAITHSVTDTNTKSKNII